MTMALKHLVLTFSALSAFSHKDNSVSQSSQMAKIHCCWRTRTKPFMQLTDVYGSFLQQFTAIRMSDSVILVLSMWHNRSTTLNVTYIFGHVWFVRCNKLPAFLRRCNHFITALSLMCTDLHVDDGAAGPTRRSRHSSLKLKLARLLWTRPTKLRYSKYSANLFL